MEETDYSLLITKQDWEITKKQFEALYVNAAINLEHYILGIENCKKRIAEFKDEVDAIVDEVVKNAE